MPASAPSAEVADQRRLGDRLRQLRLERHLSQEELGARADLDRTAIGRLERGEIAPTTKTLLRLARALNVSRAIFFPNDH
jgi:transcriptional regulator with XRE-family HTH domain